MTTPHVAAVLLAAGRSTRMGGPERKPFLELGGRTVLARCCEAFAQVPSVTETVVVAGADQVTRVEELVAPYGARVVEGGDQRTDSVRAGVAAVSQEAGVILIHDAARPFVRPQRIEQVAALAAQRGAALLAVRVRDTVKVSTDDCEVSKTLDRERLWAAQTPQGFDAARLREVLERAAEDGFTPTDDAALFERYGGAVPLVEGDADNIKLTTQADLALGAAILRAREEETG